jgi:lipoyl-dependent peroxiredoxin
MDLWSPTLRRASSNAERATTTRENHHVREIVIAYSARTNPEELFAADWSACFESAIALAARQAKVMLPADVAIDAEVDLNLVEGGYFLSARLNVSLPGVEREVAGALVDEAHDLYSKATRGNIAVAINLV